MSGKVNGVSEERFSVGSNTAGSGRDSTSGSEVGSTAGLDVVSVVFALACANADAVNGLSFVDGSELLHSI